MTRPFPAPTKDLGSHASHEIGTLTWSDFEELELTSQEDGLRWGSGMEKTRKSRDWRKTDCFMFGSRRTERAPRLITLTSAGTELLALPQHAIKTVRHLGRGVK